MSLSAEIDAALAKADSAVVGVTGRSPGLNFVSNTAPGSGGAHQTGGTQDTGRSHPRGSPLLSTRGVVNFELIT